MGFFILEETYFWLKAKDLNDNGYLLTNQFDKNDQFHN
jgi:hypothetical protein